MCGKVEESILRRSLGRRPYCVHKKKKESINTLLKNPRRLERSRQTFAINSLFLNSPLTKVTFPLISNSVHRNRSSFVALDTNPRPILKLLSVPSSISAGPWLRFALAASAALFRLKSNNLRNSGRFLVDDARAPDGPGQWRDGEIGNCFGSVVVEIRPRDGRFVGRRRAKRLASTVARHGAGSRDTQFDVAVRLEDEEWRHGDDEVLAVK